MNFHRIGLVTFNQPKDLPEFLSSPYNRNGGFPTDNIQVLSKVVRYLDLEVTSHKNISSL